MESRDRDEYIRQAIDVADQIKKAIFEADSYKQECLEISKKIDTLRTLMFKAMRLSASAVYYDQPTRRIMDEAKKTLDKTLTLVKKCKKSGILKRVITITSATDFRRVNITLDSTFEDLKWLIAVSAGGNDTGGLPPIVATDPNLAFLWQQIARVHAGNAEDKADGAINLASMAASSERNGKIIIEEGGLVPLIKLLHEGTPDGQENAAKALMDLACDQQRAQEIVKCGAIAAFVHVLSDGTVKVQTQAAKALAAIVSCDKEAQSAFGAAGVIRHLVALINDTIDEASRKNSNVSNMHAVARMAQSKAVANNNKPWGPEDDHLHLNTTTTSKPGTPNNNNSNRSSSRPQQNGVAGEFHPFLPRKSHTKSSDSLSLENGKTYFGSSHNRRDRDNEDPESIRNMRAAVVKALWMLAIENVRNCKSITDTRALLCFAKLIEKEEGEVQKNAVMAVAAIAMVAEQDQELRRGAFRMPSVSVKAVVDQLLQVIKHGVPELQTASVKAIGCLARIFPAKETHIVKPLTDQLQNPVAEVVCEAAKALQKFTHPGNYLKEEHSKSILEASGASPLVQLIIIDSGAQQAATILLCNLALNVGGHPEFKDPGVLRTLQNATRVNQLMQVPLIKELLPKAINHLQVMATPEGDEFIVNY